MTLFRKSVLPGIFMVPYHELSPKLVMSAWTAIDGNREDLRQWLPFIDSTKKPSDLAAYYAASRGSYKGQDGAWGAFLIHQETDRNNLEVIGAVGGMARGPPTHMELGYWMAPSWRQKGIMTAATRLLSAHYSGACGYEKLMMAVESTNAASNGVPRKLGFDLEVTRRHYVRNPGTGQLSDLNFWGLMHPNGRNGDKKFWSRDYVRWSGPLKVLPKHQAKVAARFPLDDLHLVMIDAKADAKAVAAVLRQDSARPEPKLSYRMPWFKDGMTEQELTDVMQKQFVEAFAKATRWSAHIWSGWDAWMSGAAKEPELLGFVTLSRLSGVSGAENSDPLISGVERATTRHGAIAYWCAPNGEGLGLTSAAAAAMADMGFMELDLDRIEVSVEPDNKGSTGVAKNLGCSYEGGERGAPVLLRGADRGPTLDTWSVLAGEWKENRSALFGLDSTGN